MQACVRRFRTVPCRMQFHLCVALLLSNALLLVSPLTTGTEYCFLLALGKYMCFLSAFIWVSLIAGDICWTMHLSSRYTQSLHTNKHMRIFSCCAWGTACLLAVVLGISDKLNPFGIPQGYLPLLGGQSCWFTTKNGLILYFFVPVALSTALNMVFFVTTSIHLHGAQQQARDVRGDASPSRNITVYLRLACIMGVSWSVICIAPLANNTVVWYISVVVSALQGVYIFAAFALEELIAQCKSLCTTANADTATSPHRNRSEATQISADRQMPFETHVTSM